VQVQPYPSPSFPVVPPGSRVPVYCGLAAAAVAVLGLLFTVGTGVVVTVLIARGTGETTDPEGSALAPRSR
jgi:hypothetical protein